LQYSIVTGWCKGAFSSERFATKLCAAVIYGKSRVRLKGTDWTWVLKGGKLVSLFDNALSLSLSTTSEDIKKRSLLFGYFPASRVIIRVLTTEATHLHRHHQHPRDFTLPGTNCSSSAVIINVEGVVYCGGGGGEENGASTKNKKHAFFVAFGTFLFVLSRGTLEKYERRGSNGSRAFFRESQPRVIGL